MKIGLVLFCIAAVVLVFIVACSKKRANEPGVANQGDREQAKDAGVLNYEEMIPLDAEDLGEGSIGEDYKEKVLPVLRKYVAAPAEVIEERDSKGDTYKVTSQGKTYVIYSPGMDLNGGQNWGNATFALFDIVNRQLQNSPRRFYAINGGNDLGGMFLTKETYDRAIKSLKRKTDWPYLPDSSHPWYGQAHD